MTTSQGELFEEKGKISSSHQGGTTSSVNSSNKQSYQRVADRVQQWNRAIPEAGYITLGTIRYGVRLSAVHPLADSPTSSTMDFDGGNKSSSVSVNSNVDRRNSSNSSTYSNNNSSSCCCLGGGGSSTIVLPSWNSNYSRTKLPIARYNAKNRTLSTSQSSSPYFAASGNSIEVSKPQAATISTSNGGSLQQIQTISSQLPTLSSTSNTTVASSPSSNSNSYQPTSVSRITSEKQHKYLNKNSREMSENSLATIPHTGTQIDPIIDSNATLSAVGSCAPADLKHSPPISSGDVTSASASNNSSVDGRRKCVCSCCTSTCSPGCCKITKSVSSEQCRENSASPPHTKIPLTDFPLARSYSVPSATIDVTQTHTVRSSQKKIPRPTGGQSIGAAVPPKPPPKTFKNSDEQPNDAINFRRKLQKFETRNKIEAVAASGCDPLIGKIVVGLNCFTTTSSSSTNTVDERHDPVTSNGSNTIFDNFDSHEGTPTKSNIVQTNRYGYSKKSNTRNISNGHTASIVGIPPSSGSNFKDITEFSRSKLKSLSDSPTASIAIRKLTPKLARKLNATHRGISEDRLIDKRTEIENLNDEEDADEEQEVIVSYSDNNHHDLYHQIIVDDDSDIGFIDSSADDGDRLSLSLGSDIEFMTQNGQIHLNSERRPSTGNDIAPVPPRRTSSLDQSFESDTKKTDSVNKHFNEIFNENSSTRLRRRDVESGSVPNFSHINNNISGSANETEKLNICTNCDRDESQSCICRENFINFNNNSNQNCSNSACIVHNALKKNKRSDCVLTNGHDNYEIVNFVDNAKLRSFSDSSSICSSGEISGRDIQTTRRNNSDTRSECVRQVLGSPGSPASLPAISSSNLLTPSSLSAGLLKGSFIISTKLYPSESFGYFTKSPVNVGLTSEHLMSMEKRRTFDRMVFGKKRDTSSSSSSSPTPDTRPSSRKLRDLTELLKGNRSSPIPPPIPPPRRPRILNNNEKPTDPLSPHQTDDIIHMDAEEDRLVHEPINRRSDDISHKIMSSSRNSESSLYQMLRPNSSVTNLENLIISRDLRGKSKSPPPILPPHEENFFTKLMRPEEKTIVGSYTQKPTIFRSFSLIDRLRNKGKGPAADISNLTLPRRKENLRGSSPKLNEVATPQHTSGDSAENSIKKSSIDISLECPVPEINKISIEEVVTSPDVIKLEEPANEQGRNVCVDGDPKTSDNKLSADISPKLNAANNPPNEDLGRRRTQKRHHRRDRRIEPLSMNYVDASKQTLETLTEAEISLESPPENLHQTATTCLIPVPVYECEVKEWNIEQPVQQWVDIAKDEVGMTPEIVEATDILGPTTLDDILKSDKTVENALCLSGSDHLPTISVSQESQSGSSDSCGSSPELRNMEERSIDFGAEVKKRNSNNNDEGKSDNDRANASIHVRTLSSEDKKRIDKSRRRKGMYIQWPAIEKLGSTDWSDEAIEMEAPAGPLEPKDSITTSSSGLTPSVQLNTPSSQTSFDLNTPESEHSHPVWPSAGRRSSLTCQSSEEKDDPPSTASPCHKSLRNLMFHRTDSFSDNENDRSARTISRDRTSPSPAPGTGSDFDLKRYSKRPLRGPYGQMLEAEMKKPGKLQYDEILEELKNAESLNNLSPAVRLRGDASSRSYDDTVAAAESNSAVASNLHGTKSSMRSPKKPSGYLPLPVHTRAASTPSQMEHTTPTSPLIPQHKRYQSSLDNTSMDNIRRSKDSIRNENRDRSPKRASSEVVDTKRSPKRSSSNASEKQPKRSLDEMRLSQSSRTPSERSMVSLAPESVGKGGNQNLLPTPELLAQLLKGSSERLVSEQRQQMLADTRTHVVQEIFRNEQSYVESLQTVVMKYLHTLKTPEYAGMIDSKTVDEIFFMVPDILGIHEKFLNEMRMRLDVWDAQQKVGDAFIETFSKTEVLETYTSFVNNCNRAKEAIKTTSQTRPSFARFLESNAREHKGKLSLDNLLIKPVQKFPNYEMLFTRLIKHTDEDHPDQKPLQEVLKLVHDILVHINCKEKEVLENGQREATLRELEGIIEGASDLVFPERQFLLFDLVSMPSGQGARKERGFFLFSDILIITSIKRRSGTIRKPNPTMCPGSVVSTLDTNKYKFLTRVSLEHMEIVKNENLRKIMNEIEQLAEDCNKLNQISEITMSLKCPHISLEETIRDLQREVQRQLSEKQTNDAQLNILDLTVNSPGGSQHLTVVFSKSEKRSHWEEIFNDAKQKLVASLERHPAPEFLMSIPIRKTRAGLQFTCATPTLSSTKDVWVCNSDGYVGQVCVLSLSPEPNVTSCNGVCNARILCVASVPAATEITAHSISSSAEETPRSSRNSNSSNCHSMSSEKVKISTEGKSETGSDIQLDSTSSSDDSEIESANTERPSSPSSLQGTVGIGTAAVVVHHQHQDSSSDDPDGQQSTMWLGTEDGCIHVYNCTDNIRIKKNKIKIQHVSAVYSILYLDNRVFVALANGDICVYLRDNAGWNTSSPHCIPIGTVTSPVNKLLSVHGKLWCSIQGIIKVLDTKTLQVENQIQISSDSKPITNMAVANNYVWISIQNSAHIKCFHSNSYEQVFEVNLAPSVNKMLSNCDDIIRQHKAACLRVTSLLACKDLIWIGTSAGVLLTIPTQGYTKGSTITPPVATGIPHGHTGHVRFLTYVETERKIICQQENQVSSNDSLSRKSRRHSSQNNKTKPEPCGETVLVISGGDGYEDFRGSGANTMSEVAGREDSTNHLLLWQI